MIIALVTMLFNWSLITDPKNSTAKAASNLLDGGNFEGNISQDWNLWTNSSRNYELYRYYGSQNRPFGLGSYSGAISAEGNSEGHWQAGLSSKNGFELEAGNDYYLIFYTKSTSNSLDLSLYLDDKEEAISKVAKVKVDQEWEKHIILFSPTKSGDSYLSMAFGDIPNNSSLVLDGLGLYLSDLEISTDEVKKSIGERAKLRISDIEMFDPQDIEIELPYFDPRTKTKTTIMVNPTDVKRNYLYFNYPQSTYAGIGRVHVNGQEIGSFTYNVELEITEIYPQMVRADEDVTIVGTGFHPDLQNNMHIIMRVAELDGGTCEHWTQPTHIDSRLTQVTVSIPYGITSYRMYAQSSFTDKNGEAQVNKSGYISYKVKPIVHNVEWSQRGYDQVGDKLRISGKGIAYRPRVIFYDMQGNKVDSKRAELVEISDAEYIEVDSTTKTNEYQLTVMSKKVESDNADMNTHSAKPKIGSVRADNYRRVSASKERIYAAKVGEIIRIKGEGFDPKDTQVEFQGVNGKRISVDISPEDISRRNTTLSVEVPASATAGYMNIVVNGQRSNSLPLEMVPEILGHEPAEINANSPLTIRATGIGTDTRSAKVELITDDRQTEAKIQNIEYINEIAYVTVITPNTVSSNNTSLTLTYDRWSSEGEVSLSAQPTITSAGFNKDTKVLTIKGYGFSVSSRENEITYMYADEGKTVIDPDAKILEIKNTNQGQEIKIKIDDDYHYGYVKVTVDGKTSNEAQFGPVNITRIARRKEYIGSESKVMGVLYISGRNMGENGGVRIGNVWADVHYRNDFFIIAVVDEQDLYQDPVVVARDN